MSDTTNLENGFIWMKRGESPARRYERVRDATEEILRSSDPRHRAAIARENQSLLKLRNVQPGAVQDHRFLANVSLQYANDEYIGELIMPPVEVPQLSGEYPTYDKRSRLAAPDDSMAGRSTPNEINDARGVDTYACKGYALKNFVEVVTLKNQVAPLDEMVDLTEATAELMALRREIRIATKVNDATQYAAANKATLSAGSRWDDPGGDIIKNWQDAIAALWHGRAPSMLGAAMSIDVWNVIARNPDIRDLFKYGGTRPGLARPEWIAEFFGLDFILVSKARQDTANEGQTASYSRIWGKSCWIGRVAKKPSIRMAAFGMTPRFQGIVKTDVWFDQSVGTMGGYYARVSAHEDHKVVAADTAFLYSTAVN